jgi:hypothetical protein
MNMSVQTDYYIPQMRIKDETISACASEITRLREALETADAALNTIQSAAVKGVPHGMNLNNVRAIVASALRPA